MNHSDVQDHMADYLEGHLPLEKRALFDAHLDDCSNCFGEIREVQRTITLLRSLPEPEVPHGFAESVIGLVREREDRASWTDSLREALKLLVNPRVLVPASVAMIALGIIGGTRQVQDALPIPASSPQFAGQIQPVEDSRLAGIPIPGTSFERAPVNRARRNPTLQIRFYSDPVLTNLLGPIRVPAYSVAELAPVFSRQFLRNDGQVGARRVADGFIQEVSPGQTGVLRVAAPTQGGTQGMNAVGMGVGNSTQRLPLESQPTPDAWLARLRRSPGDFASLLSNSSLAEQELWIANLTRHAMERGELNEVIAALRESSSKKANLLAEDFATGARGPIADGSRLDDPRSDNSRIPAHD